MLKEKSEHYHLAAENQTIALQMAHQRNLQYIRIPTKRSCTQNLEGNVLVLSMQHQREKMKSSALKSGPVRFFALKMRQPGPGPVLNVSQHI